MKRILVLVSVLALSLALLSACAASAAEKPTPVLDPDLAGQWTTAADRTHVAIDAQGQPVGDFPIGVWFEFRADGTYFSSANHMTFAIGGISVEEGRYEAKDGVLRLTQRTFSFYPFEGSPQKKQVRTPQSDATLTYAIGSDADGATLSLVEKDSQAMVFHAAKK